MNSLKIILAFLLIAFSADTASAQTKEEIAIDSLLQLCDTQINDGNDKGAFYYALKASSLANQYNIQEKMAECYFSLCLLSYNMGLNSESLAYATKGKKASPPGNELTMSKLRLLESAVFWRMGLEKQALKLAYINVATLSQYPDKKGERLNLRNTCELITSIYTKREQHDSVKKYNQIVKSLLFSEPEAEMYNTIADFYSKEAFIVYERSQNIDSALTLFNKSLAIKAKYHHSSLFSEYYYLGKFYSDKNTAKSLEYYLKCVADAEARNINLFDFLDVYLSISELYGKMGDLANEKKYLSLYLKKTQVVNDQHKKSTEYILSAIHEQNQEEQDKLRINQYRILGIAGGSILLLGSVVFFFYRNKQRRQKARFTEKLEEKDLTVEGLNKRVNETFEELVQLAKKNNPQFLVRFQEVYPDFLKKMMMLNEKLTVAELTIVAYHYLGFTTKDIANYTFKALRTVEGVRYRLRKKLHVAPEENFILWIRNYIDSI
ncbi:helix-turn-helix transcriptional regulator [Flavobacterium sp. PLA-1-15]|uniref:helix-turn-helix transcriptional regulator n=1 Tax=Flavobacterium sp. PLA-1-15 TaxID=3380533 RepID=UPI003B760A50